MTRRRDAALAGGVLAFALVLARFLSADPRPRFAFAGALGTVVAEALAYRFESRVRRLWARGAVRAGATLVAAVAVLAGALVAPGAALSLAAGALGAYLLLLGLVAGRAAVGGE